MFLSPRDCSQKALRDDLQKSFYLSEASSARGVVQDRKETRRSLCRSELIPAVVAEVEEAGHLVWELGREGSCGDHGVDLRGILRATCLLSESRWPPEAGAMAFLKGYPIF